MEIKEPNYFQQTVQRWTTAMKDKSLTSRALLRSKLCLALLTRHLCFRRIWWIMKTASFTVQGTKAIFHWHHYALAAARGKWRKNSSDFSAVKWFLQGKRNKNKTTKQHSKYCLRTSLSGWALVCTGCLCTGFFCSRDAQEGRGTQMGACLVGFGGRDISAFIQAQALLWSSTGGCPQTTQWWLGTSLAGLGAAQHPLLALLAGTQP